MGIRRRDHRMAGRGIAAALAMALAVSTAAVALDEFVAAGNSTEGRSTEGAIAWPTVNRSAKGDRLAGPRPTPDKPSSAPIERRWNRAPATQPRIPVGCEPAFSPLAGSVSADFTARCLAGIGRVPASTTG
jgi:hypothetical protein